MLRDTMRAKLEQPPRKGVVGNCSFITMGINGDCGWVDLLDLGLNEMVKSYLP